MKPLFGILTGALVFFITVAMIQEWDVFAAAWFGHQPEAAVVGDAEKTEITADLRHFLTLSSHLYRADGDPRFAERLPAAPRVVDQLMADIVYLRHNGRYQEPVLEQLEIGDIRILGPDEVEVTAREFWIIRTRSLADGAETDPVRSEISRVRYRMSRESTGWTVQAWQLESGLP